MTKRTWITVLIGVIMQALLNIYILFWTILGFFFVFFIQGSSFVFTGENQWMIDQELNEILRFLSTMAIVFMICAALFLLINLLTNVLTTLAVLSIKKEKRQTRIVVFLIIAIASQLSFGFITLFEPITCSLFFITAICYSVGLFFYYKDQRVDSPE